MIRRLKKKLINYRLHLTLTVLWSATVTGQSSWLETSDGNVKIKPYLQFGQLYIASHSFQWGDTGTEVDLVDEGGQGNLFSYQRLGASLQFINGFELSSFFQPLYLPTQSFSLPEPTFFDQEKTFPLQYCTEFF